MNRRTLYIVGVVVVLVHLGIYYLLSHLGSAKLGKRPAVPTAIPNFGVSEQVYEESGTGAKVRYQEIRVSTTMADPEMVDRILKERAAKNAATATPAPEPSPAPIHP